MASSKSDSPKNGIFGEIWDLLTPWLIFKIIVGIIVSAALAMIGVAATPAALPIFVLVVALRNEPQRAPYI